MNSKIKILLLIIIILSIFVIGYGYFKGGFQKTKRLNEVPQNEFPPKETIDLSIDTFMSDKKETTENWKTYKDEEYGFQFKYPPDWQPRKLPPLASWRREVLNIRLADLKDVPQNLILRSEYLFDGYNLSFKIYKADGFTFCWAGEAPAGSYYSYNYNKNVFEFIINNGGNIKKEEITFDELLNRIKNIKTRNGLSVLICKGGGPLGCFNSQYVILSPDLKISSFVPVFEFGICSNDFNFGDNYRKLEEYVNKYDQIIMRISQTFSWLKNN